MNCSRCGGLSLFEDNHEFIGWRCFNCGKRSQPNEFIEFETFERVKKFDILKELKKKYRRVELQLLTIKCPFCLREFTTTSKIRRFCDDRCATADYESRKRFKRKNGI